jgi:hypothetical protein
MSVLDHILPIIALGLTVLMLLTCIAAYAAPTPALRLSCALAAGLLQTQAMLCWLASDAEDQAN